MLTRLTGADDGRKNSEAFKKNGQQKHNKQLAGNRQKDLSVFLLKGVENNMDKIKLYFISVTSVLMSWLGVLAVPILLLVGCNLVDYFTGLCAAKYRTENISSYKGIRGIIKKVCMWLLIAVGWTVDVLIKYAAANMEITFVIPFVVATVVAVWLICNEIISILENMLDIGVELPPFLLPLAKNIKKKVEANTELKERERE